jgi:myo-inositol 2-dehydrogenase/D-chiro-inositol 1-dehydrogenase
MKDKPNTPNPTTTRRKFLRTTTAATAAATLSPATHAFAAGSDTLKVAVIGTGGRGSGAIVQNLKNEGTEFVAVAEAFKDRLDSGMEKIAKAHNGPGKINVSDQNKFVGLDAYKEAIDKADVVILATPPGLRPMMFEEAIKQGKNVFMEKPVCTDAPGYRRVIAAAKEADAKNLKVVVGLQRRYQTSYIDAYNEVKNGTIGDLISARCYWNSGGVWTRPRGAVAEALGREPTEMEYQIYNWYYFTWLCGDHIAEQHIHNIDVINWFTSADPAKGGHPVKARGVGGRQIRTDKENGQIYDHHSVEFFYEDGLVNHSQCKHMPGWGSVSESILGTKGRLEMDNKGGAMFYDHKGNLIKRIKNDTTRNPYDVEHAALYKAIRQDKPLNNAYYGADSSMTCVLGRMCTYSGKEITWDDAVAKGKQLVPDSLSSFDEDPPVMPDADGFYPVAQPGTYDPFESDGKAPAAPPAKAKGKGKNKKKAAPAKA